MLETKWKLKMGMRLKLKIILFNDGIALYNNRKNVFEESIGRGGISLVNSPGTLPLF